MLLTKQQREEFIIWLRQEIDSNKKLLEQMEKLPTPDALKRMYKMRIGAYTLVANDLENTEEQTIGNHTK